MGCSVGMPPADRVGPLKPQPPGALGCEEPTHGRNRDNCGTTTVEKESILNTIDVPATAYLRDQSRNVVIQGDPRNQYGADTLLGGPDEGAAKLAAFAVYAPAQGRYALSACYTSCESRPVNVEINGAQVMVNAMSRPTHGSPPACWRPDGREWVDLLVVDLIAGKNLMRVFTPTAADFLPHIVAFRFVQLNASCPEA